MGLKSMEHLDEIIDARVKEILKTQLKTRLSAVRYGQRGKQIKLTISLGTETISECRVDIQDLIERN